MQMSIFQLSDSKFTLAHSKSGETLVRNGRLIDTQINNHVLSALIAVTVKSCLKSQYHKIDRKNVADYLTYIIQ